MSIADAAYRFFSNAFIRSLFEESLDIRIKNTYVYTMTVQEVLKLLRNDGWFVYEQSGSHIQLKYYVKKGRVTVPNHKSDLKQGTLHSILKQAGLE